MPSASEELNLSREAYIWRDAEGAEGLVVPLLLVASSSGVEHDVITPSGLRYIIKIAKGIPGFKGTVYAMSSRRNTSYVKIGFSKDAGKRMKKSSSDKRLGYTKSADRVEISVFLCYDVNPKDLEQKVHKALCDKNIDIGFGREWFETTVDKIIGSVQDISSGTSRFWLSQYYQDEVEQKIFQIVIKEFWPLRAPVLVELGEVRCITRSATTMQVYYSLWCPVRYELLGEVPMPFFLPPTTATNKQIALFADEIRRLTPPDDRCVLDVHEIDGCLYPRHPDQHIEFCEETGWLSSDGIWDPSMTLDEWVVDRTIYKVDFSVRLDILDTFEFREDEMVLRERAVLP